MVKKLYSSEEAKQKFQSLPKEIQDLLYSFEMTSIITKVGEKNGLHFDQMGSLNTEVSYVMLGLTTTEEFPSILAEDLGVDEKKASEIAKDVSEMLFAKIREAMQKPAIPTAAPEAPANPPAVAAAPVPAAPAKATEIHPADLMLTQKTVVAPAAAEPAAEKAAAPAPTPAQKTEPPKPEDYKADPYREPAI